VTPSSAPSIPISSALQETSNPRPPDPLRHTATAGYCLLPSPSTPTSLPQSLPQFPPSSLSSCPPITVTADLAPLLPSVFISTPGLQGEAALTLAGPPTSICGSRPLPWQEQSPRLFGVFVFSAPWIHLMKPTAFLEQRAALQSVWLSMGHPEPPS
jgi:hypothetical protein